MAQDPLFDMSALVESLQAARRKLDDEALDLFAGGRRSEAGKLQEKSRDLSSLIDRIQGAEISAWQKLTAEAVADLNARKAALTDALANLQAANALPDKILHVLDCADQVVQSVLKVLPH